MKNYLLLLFVVLMLILPFSYGWNWRTHEDFVVGIYYLLDDPVRNELDLDEMKRGATAPDKKFKDFVRHSYPASYEEATYWLEKAKDSYDNQDYRNSSYYFGVASHYISDSFSSPHNVKGEKGSLHSAYEKKAYFDRINFECIDKEFDLEKELINSLKTGDDWEEWIKTRKVKIIKDHLGKGFTVLFLASKNLYVNLCNDLIEVSDYGESSFNFDLGLEKIIVLSIVSGIIVVTTSSLLKE